MDAFQAFQAAIGATPDKAAGMLTITSEQYANLQPLSFDIGGIQLTLTRNGLIWPRVHNVDIGGYLIVSDIGSLTGCGLDFIINYRALRRLYTVFDTAKQQVGFTPTAHTLSTEN